MARVDLRFKLRTVRVIGSSVGSAIFTYCLRNAKPFGTGVIYTAYG
ncbi:MAG: hypothetical protein ABSG46_10135 [Candidatus Binataceae bacterium]|jgi:hypothetical protein